jgi:protein phosphatase
LNRTSCIDTGCVFGGRLTALRYPERELVSVPAAATYYQPAKPFLPPEAQAPALTAQQAHDDLLDMEDVSGKRIIKTRIGGNVTIREENATTALEMISRFAVDPKWLIYLPPTMSPSETTTRPGLLEHPAEAFAYFRGQGVPKVVCEEKHMGSRAVVIVCRDEEVARKRFGIAGTGSGVCLTRTGRRFFSEEALETGLLARVRAAFDTTDLWRKLETDWACLDCELMPWSVKAQELLRSQYAAVGSAATPALAAAAAALSAAANRGGDVAAGVRPLLERTSGRATAIGRYIDAYRRYCWDVTSLTDLKLAPFHLLATEGRVHVDKDHAWHMGLIADLCTADTGLLRATPWRTVDLADPTSESDAIAWWEQLTASGGEGMVVKPLTFITRGPHSLVQPAVKCRGAEYLRIIYGPEYLAPDNLERLRARGLSAKRGLALREFALGVEALERFVRREPLRRVHECVFGVLALESEPVDPRL